MDGYKQKNAYIGTQGTSQTANFQNEESVECIDEMGLSSTGVILSASSQ